MFNRYFLRIYDFICQRKWQSLVFILILTITATVSLHRVPFDNNVESMLSGNADVMRTMHFLRESHFSDKAVISFELKSQSKTIADLLQTVDNFKSALDPEFIKSVIGGIAKDDLSQDLVNFTRYVPQLIDQRGITDIESRITPFGVRESLKRVYRQVFNPAIPYYSL